MVPGVKGGLAHLEETAIGAVAVPIAASALAVAVVAIPIAVPVIAVVAIIPIIAIIAIIAIVTNLTRGFGFVSPREGELKIAPIQFAIAEPGTVIFRGFLKGTDA